MTLIHEIHGQPYHIRLAMWGLSVFSVISVVGYFWFNSLERDIFLALHDDQLQRETFLAAQDQRAPKTFGAISDAFGSLTADIGSVLGIDRSKGFDRPAVQDTVYLLPLSK